MSRSVVLDHGESQVAVGIVGRIVGETSPVGKSILVPESRGVENAVDRVWWVGVGLAIVSSVFGCIILVKDTFGCGRSIVL